MPKPSSPAASQSTAWISTSASTSSSEISARSPAPSSCGRDLARDHVALDALHQVERRADHGGVGAGREHARHARAALERRASLGGGEPRLVAGGPNDEAMPRWSPDGSRIAFLSDDGTGMNVYWVPPTGGARRKIAQTHLQYLDRFTSIGAVGSQPWSPDGRRLVFSRLEPTNSVALWTADIESGQEARLTSPPAGASDWRGAWSHDGKWIAFNRSATGSPSNLYLVPASGGEPRAVLPDETVTRGAATWSLDDRRLLFVVPAGSVRWRRLGGRNRNREDQAADGRG